MQVKIYSGNSTAAVLAEIKEDLGPDAVILDTRETQENGVREVRITAALDRGAQAPNGNSGRAYSPLFSAPPSAGSGYAGIPATAGNLMSSGWQLWYEEWNSIKGHLLALMKPELQFGKLTPRQRLAVEFLQREGVDDSVVLELFKKLQPTPGASVLDPLAELVPIRPWGEKDWAHTLHLVCGPFGTGKTTAAVRMALHLRKHSPHLRVALLNADGERGGGRLLLRNYAELSEIEYREARTRLEAAAAMAELHAQGFNRIIVDMPGLTRVKSMPEQLAESGFDTPAAAMHLVLPPHFDAGVYRSLIARYAPGPRGPRDVSIVWSKLDEAEKFGALVNVASGSHIPVSALSFGPGLRDTLVPVRDVSLWRLLFKKELPAASAA